MRRMAIRGLAALAGIGFWTQFVCAQTVRRVILIGWDGAQREHVQECLARGQLPTLRQLANEGALVEVDIRGATDTKAGWSQILTGYDPDVTGVYNNQRFQAVPAGLSLFERLRDRFGSNDFACVAVIGKKAHCGPIDPPSREEISAAEAERLIKTQKTAASPRDDRADNQEGRRWIRPRRQVPEVQVVQENGRWYRMGRGQPYANMHRACDVWEFGLLADKAVGRRAIELLERFKDKGFFFFVHFAEVDHKGHQDGENSEAYEQALISNDLWTGRIIETLKTLGLYEETRLYVTSDHGFDEGGRSHRNAPRVFLATNDRNVCRKGDRADIAPTIYEAFGMNPREFQPALAGKSLRCLETRVESVEAMVTP